MAFPIATETAVAILFIIILSIFLWFKRDKIKLQKWLYPLLYMILYRTKLGLKAMDSLAKKWPRIVKYLAYIGVAVGFLGMLVTVVYLIIMLWQIFQGSTQAAVGVAQPFVKTKFGSPFIYIPLSYFIVSIFIIAVSHEFCHGIVARLFNIRIKSSGFAFFSVLIPILPAAFVEPDEKQVKKIKPIQQLAIFAAGPFANILLAAVFLGIIFAADPMMSSLTTQDVLIVNYTDGNITFPAEKAGVKIGEAITRIDNVTITTINDFVSFMTSSKPGQTINFTTNVSSYEVILAESPAKEGVGYIGLMTATHRYYKAGIEESLGIFLPTLEWLIGLFVILFIFNLGVALINLAPIGPLDGGRMILTLLNIKYEEKKSMIIWGKISLIMLIILLADIFLPTILKLFR